MEPTGGRKWHLLGTPGQAPQAAGSVRVLDAGALIALDRGDRDAWALLVEAHQEGERPVIPAPVIAQAWRGGGRQARLASVLAGADVVAADGPLPAALVSCWLSLARPTFWTPWSPWSPETARAARS